MTSRQRYLEFLSANHGVIEKHFVEIAKSKEEQRTRILALDFVVLPEHGGGVLHVSFTGNRKRLWDQKVVSPSSRIYNRLPEAVSN
jgi:hypothetical protein